MTLSIRLALVALLLPIVGCSVTTNTPPTPAPAPSPVVVAPPSGAVVVQPAQ